MHAQIWKVAKACEGSNAVIDVLLLFRIFLRDYTRQDEILNTVERLRLAVLVHRPLNRLDSHGFQPIRLQCRIKYVRSRIIPIASDNLSQCRALFRI